MMRNISKKYKIILLLLTLLIICGIATLCITGFKKSGEFGAGTRIELYIPKGYEKQDIINIANESFKDKQYIFEKIEKLDQVVGIKIENYTEEEINTFKSNICKKYDIEEKSLQLHEIPFPTVKLSDIIIPYVFPVVLVTILSLIYVLFKNLKSENKWKKVLKVILTLTLVLGTFFSIILVLRLPFGSYTMPLALTIYIMALITSVNNIKE